jgi:hypothetical protein
LTNISKNTKFDKKEKSYKLISEEKNILSNVEGEFTNSIRFDGKSYWNYDYDGFPKIRSMKYILFSDSIYRDDLVWMKKGEENLSQRFKVKLEEIQRKEKKLREENLKAIKKK